MIKHVIDNLPGIAGVAAGAAYLVTRNRYINSVFSNNNNHYNNSTMVPVSKAQKIRSSSAVAPRNYPYSIHYRRRYSRRYRYRLYRPIKTSNSFTFDYIVRFNVGELETLAQSGTFIGSYNLISVVRNSINWSSVSPLWNMVKLSYVKVFCRTLLSSKYFKTHPCLAIGLFPSHSTLLNTYDSIVASNSSFIWQTDRSFYFGRFNMLKFASSNMPGIGRWLALDHTSTNDVASTSFPMFFSLYANTPFVFDLQRGTSATDDDCAQTSPVLELYFKLWIRFRDPNV